MNIGYKEESVLSGLWGGIGQVRGRETKRALLGRWWELGDVDPAHRDAEWGSKLRDLECEVRGEVGRQG